MKTRISTLLLGALLASVPFVSGCFGCGADTNIPDGYMGPTPGTPVHAAIAGGASIDGMLTGTSVQLSSAPTSFEAPLHVKLVSRAGYEIHSRADLVAACAVPLAAGESPAFQGDFLFNPMDPTAVDQAILSTDVAQNAKLVAVDVSNLPQIASARTDEPSLTPWIERALQNPSQNAHFTSANWQLLCDSLDYRPSVRVLLSGSFSGQDWEAEIRIDDLWLELQ